MDGKEIEKGQRAGLGEGTHGHSRTNFGKFANH